MRTMLTTHVAGTPDNRYGVVLCDMLGNPVLDRQYCAARVADAVAIARADMKERPFSCATVYRVECRGGADRAVPVRYISPAGKVTIPQKEEKRQQKCL